MPEPVTFRTFITSFTDFLTVAIHTILYERHIYPPTSFLSARKYNFAVRQSRHPLVCEWIDDAVSAVRDELYRCNVARIVLVVLDCATNAPLERFVFDVSRFPVVPATEFGTPLRSTALQVDEGTTAGSEQAVSVLPFVELEEQMRATMSRLSGCAAHLAALPHDCTFSLALELKDDGEPPIRHPQPWIPVQPSLQKSVRGWNQERHVLKGDDLGGARTMPVRNVNAGEMLFEVWIEESKVKFEEATDATDSTTTHS